MIDEPAAHAKTAQRALPELRKAMERDAQEKPSLTRADIQALPFATGLGL